MRTIELTRETRARAVTSIQQYFEQNLPEAIGELAAGLLLDFFLEEIGPAIYNRAIGDVQAWVQQRVADLEGELYADEFQYWQKLAAKQKRQRG